jgi:hypothetical protein
MCLNQSRGAPSEKADDAESEHSSQPFCLIRIIPAEVAFYQDFTVRAGFFSARAVFLILLLFYIRTK